MTISRDLHTPGSPYTPSVPHLEEHPPPVPWSSHQTALPRLSGYQRTVSNYLAISESYPVPSPHHTPVSPRFAVCQYTGTLRVSPTVLPQPADWSWPAATTSPQLPGWHPVEAQQTDYAQVDFLRSSQTDYSQVSFLGARRTSYTQVDSVATILADYSQVSFEGAQRRRNYTQVDSVTTILAGYSQVDFVGAQRTSYTQVTSVRRPPVGYTPDGRRRCGSCLKPVVRCARCEAVKELCITCGAEVFRVDEVAARCEVPGIGPLCYGVSDAVLW